MKTNIVLKRAVSVRCWRVVGEIARASKRAELIPLLTRVRDRGESSAADIAEHLFFESRSRRVVAERLLHIATNYRLLDNHGSTFVLTDDGVRAIDTEEVFVPEKGAWTIWASDDPLLPTTILKVEPWAEPTAYDEVWGNDRNKGTDRPFEQLPGWLRKKVKIPLVPAADSGQRLRIDQLEDKGEATDPAASIRLVWDVSQRRLRLEGRIGEATVNTDLDVPEISTSDIWRELLTGEGLWSYWDTTQQALRVEFGDTSDPERESMTRAVTFERPEIPDSGSFDSLTVSNIPITAISSGEAQEWAEWRLRTHVGEYATMPRFEVWCQEAIAPFDEYRLNLPNRSDLAAAAWRSRDRRPTPQTWHLVAAEDWRL